jgi:hypothetical protein
MLMLASVDHSPLSSTPERDGFSTGTAAPWRFLSWVDLSAHNFLVMGAKKVTLVNWNWSVAGLNYKASQRVQSGIYIYKT